MYILSHTPIQSFSSPINCFIVHWHIEELPFLKLPIAGNSLINYIGPDSCLDFYSPIQLKRTLQNNKGKPEGLSITSRHWRVLLTALARGLFIYSSSDAVRLWEQFWKANFPLLLEADLLAGDGCAVCSIWLYFKPWKPKYWFRIVSLFFLLLKALQSWGKINDIRILVPSNVIFPPFSARMYPYHRLACRLAQSGVGGGDRTPSCSLLRNVNELHKWIYIKDFSYLCISKSKWY